MKRLLLVTLLAASLILSACGAFAHSARSTVAPAPAAGIQSFRSGGAPAAPAPQEALQAPALSNDVAQAAPAGAADASAQAATDRLVVQTDELTIVVADVNARVRALEAMAKAMGGYVVSENVYQTYVADGTSVPDAQMVFRVPGDQLDQAIAQVKQGTADVQNETRAGQDVTSQYVDLQSRLTAKQAAADQLTKIMQNATKTQDVLEVYQQLQQVDSDIEVLKGQIQYYQEAAQMAAVTVHIVAEMTVKPIQVGTWQPQGVARDALQNLIYFWQAFINVLIGFFLYVLPVLLTIAIPLFLLFVILRALLRRMFKPKAQAESAK